MQAADARMHDDEHADEAGEDRHHAPPADPFAEERSGEQRDDERRHEHDRDGLVETQVAQGEEVAGRRRHHEKRAQQFELELARAQESATTGSTLSIDSMIRNWPRKRDHTICTTGRCACVTRYFAEVSRAEKKATARHMRPMAFRRSAAASVAARDGCAAASTRPPALAAAASVAAAVVHGRLS